MNSVFFKKLSCTQNYYTTKLLTYNPFINTGITHITIINFNVAKSENGESINDDTLSNINPIPN